MARYAALPQRRMMRLESQQKVSRSLLNEGANGEALQLFLFSIHELEVTTTSPTEGCLDERQLRSSILNSFHDDQKASSREDGKTVKHSKSREQALCRHVENCRSLFRRHLRSNLIAILHDFNTRSARNEANHGLWFVLHLSNSSPIFRLRIWFILVPDLIPKSNEPVTHCMPWTLHAATTLVNLTRNAIDTRHATITTGIAGHCSA